MHDYHAWDDVANVLRLIGAHTLERHAHALPGGVERRSSAVAAVYRSVDLDSQELHGSLGVGRDFYPRDDAAGDADGVTANGKADAEHVLLQPWNLRVELDRAHILPKLIVLHRENGHVALPANGEHFRQVLHVAPTPLQLHLRVPLHTVRVGEHDALLRVNAEARTARPLLPAPLPRQREIRSAVDAPDLHHRVHRDAQAVKLLIAVLRGPSGSCSVPRPARARALVLPLPARHVALDARGFGVGGSRPKTEARAKPHS
mmetsp:Transcript_40776/g.116810  ORF Transcript_40776/g.116810 Transcript_40776/m.116810 type:complete len:260 (-) Transcript_40776:2-781(-)